MCLSETALRQALAEARRACGDAMTLEDFKDLITAKPHAHDDDDADLHIFNRCSLSVSVYKQQYCRTKCASWPCSAA